ncbi:unnamed protein product [Protopolystoma xenopodis]|uniref:Uncharacterized protein n=1 Tax=Protopolystoma xenopodis TaxID=117903 RepID=A0A3S5CPA4_9PLAT|nr:unnamed protein product [Protopolystoma xenopodis]
MVDRKSHRLSRHLPDATDNLHRPMRKKTLVSECPGNSITNRCRPVWPSRVTGRPSIHRLGESEGIDHLNTPSQRVGYLFVSFLVAFDCKTGTIRVV